MTTAKFDAEKFSGKNDFGLWRIKMNALLVQQGLADSLKPAADKDKSIPKEKQDEISEKAHSTLILCLSDKVLREVSRETTAAGIWTKLESLYMTKSLANRLYMKQKLYAYKLSESRGMEDQLEEFNKAIDDLENIDVILDDEDKAIILLNALPKSFENLKDAMLFGRESSITLEEVQSALKAKELQRVNEGKKGTPNAEILTVCGNFKNSKFKKGIQGIKSFPSKPKDEGVKETRK